MCRLPQRSKSRSLILIGGLLAALVVPAAVPSQAQDKGRLIRVLQGNSDFRVRVQAAFALGNTRDASVVPALERALRDDNPAVRAAAASALGRIGSERAIPALRRAQRDSSAAVRLQVSASLRAIEAGDQREEALPEAQERRSTRSGRFPAITVIPTERDIQWRRVRYVVMLGDMNNRTRFGGDQMATLLRSEVGRQLVSMRDVAVIASPNALDNRAQREIRRRRISELRMDGSVTNLRRTNRGRDVSVRCEVSLMLLDHPEHNMRGELRGAATGSEPRRRRASRDQLQRLAAQALEGAVRSAMANADQAIRRAASR